MKYFYLFVTALLLNFSVNGQTNQYLHFDGDDDFVAIDTIASILNGSSQISMTGWFYSDALIYGSGMLGIRGGGNGDSMYVLQLSNGILECRIIIGGTLYEVVAPAGTIVAETWQHLAWIYNGSTVELFIDGVSIGSDNANGNFTGIDKPFGIGKSIVPGFNFIFKGRADEVSVWNTALSQAEILNMMNNELIGNESGLLGYYKFNQGIPGDDNTFISQLFSETGGGNVTGELNNFALIGENSNFNGILESDFQVINFPIITNKTTSSPPFDLEAYTSSGLDVTYTLVSGPASISANTVTLSGTPGEVNIKASQAGDGTYNPAEDVYSSFEVLDPATILVDLTLTNPTAGNVTVPTLGPIQVALTASIEYPDLFSIDSIEVTIDGSTVTLTNHENGFYTGWWTPNSYGNFDVEISGTNNFGYSNTVTNTINIINTSSDNLVAAATNVWIYGENVTETVEASLPSYLGAYDQIIGTLIIECPNGGCDPWDRVSHIEAQGHDGIWHEIIRYITPYGVACDHEVDLTDFMSLLQGKINLRFTLGTSGNGFLYSLNLDYRAGNPEYNYSMVESLWSNTFAFGDLANLQPCESYEINYADQVQEAKIKLVSTGHGWGDLNTGNAAEFHHDIHNIWVDNTETFTQDNWVDCNPNPDGCQPQNGTWYYDRAGWCPGSIAQWYDFDLGNVINTTHLNYIFDQDYVDYCHPNNPDCITGQTCSDCNAGFNPHLIVQSHLISYGNEPISENEILLSYNDFDNPYKDNNFDFTVFPNPSTGKFIVDTYIDLQSDILIYDMNGKIIIETTNNDYVNNHQIDISSAAKGVYFVRVTNKNGVAVKKIIKY